MSKYFAVIFCFMLLGATVAKADELDAWFLKGNEFYQNGDYENARKMYSKILDSGFESWEVYYNIGNTYYKEKQIGRAILFYERAKRLDPQNEDVQFNLELANLGIVDRIREMPQFVLTKWIAWLADLPGLSLLMIFSYIVLIVSLIARKLFPSMKLSRMVFVTMVGLTCLFVITTGLFVFKVVYNETKTEAIVLTDKVDVRSAPDMVSTEVFTLHEGVKVQIEDHSADWVKIKLSDGKVGWLKKNVVEKI